MPRSSRNLALIAVLAACTEQSGPLATVKQAATAFERGDEAALRAYTNPDSLIEHLAAEVAKKVSANNPLLSLLSGPSRSMIEQQLRASYAAGLSALQRNAKSPKPKQGTQVLFGEKSRFLGFSSVNQNGGFATVEARFSSPDSTSPEPVVVRFELTRTNDAWRITRLAPEVLDRMAAQEKK